MFQFVLAHQFWSAVVLYWIFSAAVSAMPDPTANGNPGYTWLYRFLHTIAGNLTTAFAGRIPGLKTLAFILIVPFLLVVFALRQISATEAGITGMLEPVVAIAVAWAWLGESLEPAQLVGAALTLAGIGLAQTAR